MPSRVSKNQSGEEMVYMEDRIEGKFRFSIVCGIERGRVRGEKSLYE